MTTERLNHFRVRLQEERDRRIDDASTLLAEAKGTKVGVAKNSPAEIGSESFTRDAALGEVGLDQSLLLEIHEALRRVEAGSYGICQLTGKDIPEERLEAVPWTRFSIEGQLTVEAQQPGSPGAGKGGQLIGELQPLRNSAPPGRTSANAEMPPG